MILWCHFLAISKGICEMFWKDRIEQFICFGQMQLKFLVYVLLREVILSCSKVKINSSVVSIGVFIVTFANKIIIVKESLARRAINILIFISMMFSGRINIRAYWFERLASCCSILSTTPATFWRSRGTHWSCSRHTHTLRTRENAPRRPQNPFSTTCCVSMLKEAIQSTTINTNIIWSRSSRWFPCPFFSLLV